MDFLSALALEYQPRGTSVLVLNSAAMHARAVNLLKERAPAAVHLYLDHDLTGRELKAYFRAALPGLAVADQSGLNAGHKDVNDQRAATPRQAALYFHAQAVPPGAAALDSSADRPYSPSYGTQPHSQPARPCPPGHRERPSP